MDMTECLRKLKAESSNVIMALVNMVKKDPLPIQR
jgi:hypothetical protein